MTIVTYRTEVQSSIPRTRFFQAFADGTHKIIPKIAPRSILKSYQLIEGDGGVGSVKELKFGEDSPLTHVKERMDKIDKENSIYGYTVIGGDALGENVEKIYNEIKIEDSQMDPVGSIVKISTTLYGADFVEIKEEELQATRERSMGVVKTVEAYLLANP